MPFECHLCSRVFARKAQLTYHMENLHAEYDFDMYPSKCLEENCKISFKHIAHLREHLQSSHGKIFENETLYFASEEEFDEWKDYICKNNNVQYNSIKRNDVTYFNCNRSGRFRSKHEYPARSLKFKGSCKMNSNCTSQIILKKLDVDTYRVEYIKDHYGHEMDAQHLRIPRETRIDIATKLANGVSVDSILDFYRNSDKKEKLSRCDTITRKDISNVKAAYNISILENDAESEDISSDESEDFELPQQNEELNITQEVNNCHIPDNKSVGEEIKKACLQLSEIPAALYENETGSQILKILQNCVALANKLKSDSEKRSITETTNSHEPPNKKIKLQATYFLTEKKIKVNTNTLRKLTNSEMSMLKATLNIGNQHDYT